MGETLAGQPRQTLLERYLSEMYLRRDIFSYRNAPLEAKKRVLRAKLHLGNTQQFSNVWIRSSKAHMERLIDINFRTILDMIPGGNDMTVTNSGRITKRNKYLD